MEKKDAVAVLDGLSDETRLGVMQILVAAGAEGLPAGVIADRLGRLPSSLTFHLQQLDHAGLVSCRRMGRQIIYSAETARIAELVDYLSANCAGRTDVARAGFPDTSGDLAQWFWR